MLTLFIPAIILGGSDEEENLDGDDVEIGDDSASEMPEEENQGMFCFCVVIFCL